MSDITLSPIPYNSGTMSQTLYSRHYCDMGNGVFLNVAYQINPNYLYAWVSTNTNIKTGTFTTANSPMRALLTSSTTPAAPSAASQGVRVWKLNSNSAILLVNGGLYVIQITSSNDVVLKAGALASQTTNATTAFSASIFNYASSGSCTGAAFQGWYVRDNVFYYVVRAPASNGTYSYVLYKAVYDPSGDTLTRTSLVTSSAGGTNSTTFAQYYLTAIPGSTKKLFWVKQGTSNSSAAAATPTYAVLIDSTTDALGTVIAANASVNTLCPLGETTILGFGNTATTYFTWNGSAWNTTPCTFASTNMTGTNWQAEALDANYFAIFNYNQQAIDITASTNTTFNMRIGRYVDASFGQVSSATSGSTGIAVSMPYQVYPDMPMFVRVASDSFYAYGVTNALFTPQIRVVYQPGA